MRSPLSSKSFTLCSKKLELDDVEVHKVVNKLMNISPRLVHGCKTRVRSRFLLLLVTQELESSISSQVLFFKKVFVVVISIDYFLFLVSKQSWDAHLVKL